jgi:hypothetical protein
MSLSVWIQLSNSWESLWHPEAARRAIYLSTYLVRTSIAGSFCSASLFAFLSSCKTLLRSSSVDRPPSFFVVLLTFVEDRGEVGMQACWESFLYTMWCSTVVILQVVRNVVGFVEREFRAADRRGAASESWIVEEEEKKSSKQTALEERNSQASYVHYRIVDNQEPSH